MTDLPIRFVLVDTSHPGNIGAVARAMKNMGIGELVLVKPRQFPHPEATARASGADDLLARARVVETLAEAIADCGLVLGTTARTREQYFRVLPVREAGVRIVAEARAGSGAVAVVFGTERFGLSNEHLLATHALLRIPANPAYESLNIAMAAQLIGYEIRMAWQNAETDAAAGAGTMAGSGTAASMETAAGREAPLATSQQMEMFYTHLAQVMHEADFRDRTQSGNRLMGRIRRMFNRAELDANEVNILRGILTAVQKRRRRAGEGQ